jgi:G3E family GTPase
MLIVAPRGSGKTTLILNIISNFYKAYFHTLVVFSPTMAGDGKWGVVKKMAGILSKNPHNKELEESGGKKRPKAPHPFGKRKGREEEETEEWRAKMRIQDAFRSSWHSLFATTGAPRETVGMTDVWAPEKKKKEEEEEEMFTGRIPSENFYTDYDEDTLQGIMTQAMAKIDAFRAKGFSKHHSDRTLLVFDDLVGSTLFSAKKENPFKRLNTTQRHYSISTMMVSQAYKEIPKTVRTNASCLVLFEIQNDAELAVIYEENPCGYSRDQWMEFYRTCTAVPFGFMVLNYQKPKGQRVWKGFEQCLE